jgi:hypothetical protein
MRRRCRNRNDKNYHNYGGRGISIDPAWDDYSVFLRDMGERPKGLSLDRIDNSKGYSKANCRWASPAEQARNRRSVRHFTLDGVTRTQSEWAAITGLNSSTIHYRLRRGWTIEASITTQALPRGPYKALKRKHTHD